VSRGTDRRSIRIDEKLWVAAQLKAEVRGETISDVIRRALHDYTTALVKTRE